MRSIIYAGTCLTSTDAIAAELLEYARALAQHRTVDVVQIPVLEGEDGLCELLLGEGIPIGSTVADDALGTIAGAARALSELQARRRRLALLDVV